jgi:hypothetical protein
MSSYQPVPPGGHVPELRRPAPPAPVLAAVKLMYVGAGASAAATAVTVSNSLNSGIVQANRASPPDGFHAVEDPYLAVAWLLVGLVTVGLWIWMAKANRAGQSWARITATVLFGLNTLNLDINRADPLLLLLISLLAWLVGLGALVLLWRRKSREYFARERSEVRR